MSSSCHHSWSCSTIYSTYVPHHMTCPLLSLPYNILWLRHEICTTIWQFARFPCGSYTYIFSYSKKISKNSKFHVWSLFFAIQVTPKLCLRALWHGNISLRFWEFWILRPFDILFDHSSLLRGFWISNCFLTIHQANYLPSCPIIVHHVLCTLLITKDCIKIMKTKKRLVTISIFPHLSIFIAPTTSHVPQINNNNKYKYVNKN